MTPVLFLQIYVHVDTSFQHIRVEMSMIAFTHEQVSTFHYSWPTWWNTEAWTRKPKSAKIHLTRQEFPVERQLIDVWMTWVRESNARPTAHQLRGGWFHGTESGVVKLEWSSHKLHKNGFIPNSLDAHRNLQVAQIRTISNSRLGERLGCYGRLKTLRCRSNSSVEPVQLTDII